METIKLFTSDWLFNAGLVGLINAIGRENCIIKSNGVEIDINNFEDLEEKYFSYLIDKYERITTWNKIVDYEKTLDVIIHNNYLIDDKPLEKFNKQINFVKDKLKSNSYQSGFELLKINLDDIISKLKICNDKNIDVKNEQIIIQCNLLKKIINILKADNVKRIIVAKNIMYDVIQKFWSGVSFLHTNKNKTDMYKEYKNDFLESFKNYIKNDLEKAKYTCINCNQPILTLSSPDSYEMTWLTSIGVDTTRKSSNLWNFANDMQICPICRLVYSCVPLGFNYFYSKGFFINQNNSIIDLLKVNNENLKNINSLDESMDISFSYIIESITKQDIENKKEELNNIQVIKVDFDKSRPYAFNVLSKKMLNVITTQSELLKRLVNYKVKIDSKTYINIYEDIIDYLYNNQNMFLYTNKLFRLNTENKKVITDYCLYALIVINNEFIGGINEMDKLSIEKIRYIKYLGNELRKEYMHKEQENKIDGIAYRLLNALRTKNDKQFLDTIITIYMYHSKEVPAVFVDSLSSEEKFQTVGYAFLLGLEGRDNREQTNKGEDN